MSLELPNSVKILSDEPLDAKYLNGKVAYASLDEANTLIPIGIRSPYLTIVVQGAEYWWADGAWVLKTPHITKTLTEINALIESNGLIKGALYKITGCQTALYGGTDLYLIALETNKLDQKGVGKFFTPKYENISGNGIWTGYVECGVSTIVGLFDNNELITANNGATGQLFGNVNGGFITPLTGTWSTATSITGNASGATAVISSVSVPLTYAIGAKTIWGGYHWTNLTGNLGSKVDDYTLDSTNWSKIAYNTTDYNISYDIIEYDFENDWISYRKDKLGNEIRFNYVTNPVATAIKVFMWGFYIADERGIYGNILNQGFVNILNFRGNGFFFNSFGQSAYFFENVFAKGVLFYSNVFFRSSFYSNIIGLNGLIAYNIFNNGSLFYSNTFAQNLIFKQNNLESSVQFYSNLFSKNLTFQSNIFRLNAFFFLNKIGETFNFSHNTTNQLVSINNNIFPSNKNLFATFFESGNLTVVNFTPAIEIFASGYLKTVFSYPNGTLKIRYYNNNNVLVIADITD